jgi:hypothetical protein
MQKVTGLGGVFFKPKDPSRSRIGMRSTWTSTACAKTAASCGSSERAQRYLRRTR